MKIAIVGFGVEGKASFEYWNRPENELTIVDEREEVDAPKGTNTLLGTGAFSKLQDFDLIVRSPSIAPKKLPYPGKVWSATNEFFATCPAPIIGVTGTKGKGTTCSWIASILKAAGKTVHLVGNIGTAALEVLPRVQPDDIVVYELSSFQLWDAEKSPHVAVMLGIEPDHLDVHASFNEYVLAKSNIARYQTPGDVLVFNAGNDITTKIASMTKARTVPYPFAIDEFKDSLKIPGRHNEENAAAAIAAARELEVSNEAIRQGLVAFTGLEHRLKFVREVNGVSYYDDSIATTPGSAIAAINSFDAPKVLILGGSDKGASYDEIVDLCKTSGTKVVAIGQTGEHIAKLCAEKDVEYVREVGNMAQIVKIAADMSQAGGVVILSPASASFDMFKNYTDRGNQFIAAVEAL